MKRSESLRILAEWARLYKHPAVEYEPGSLSAVTHAHGLNAVRAIRQNVGAWTGTVVPSTDYCMREARLAFRAALNAVGLKTL